MDSPSGLHSTYAILSAKYCFPMYVGARQLFWIDVHANSAKFCPLFSFISEAVVLRQDRSETDGLPGPAYVALVTLVACFMPYYTDAKVVLHFSCTDYIGPTCDTSTVTSVSVQPVTLCSTDCRHVP